jgi:site-specific recombinase XerD
LAVNDWSPETIKAYRSDLALFDQFLKERHQRFSQVTNKTIREFEEYMKALPNARSGVPGLTDSTIARRRAAISSFYEYLRTMTDHGLVNPTHSRLRRKQKAHKLDLNGKAVDDSTLDSLLNGIDNARDRALFLLFLASGLRLSEVHQLDVASIEEAVEEQEDGCVQRWGTGHVVGKGSKPRQFVFDRSAVDAIAAYLDTRHDDNPALFLSERKQRMSKRAIQDTLARWCRKLGLKHIHVHQLRHSFATRLANANIDSMVLRDLMGHSNFSTTTKYFRLTDRTVARQYYSAMEFIRGGQI